MAMVAAEAVVVVVMAAALTVAADTAADWVGALQRPPRAAARDGHALLDRAGTSRADAMHATHLAGDKHSEIERTGSGSSSRHPHCREPNYGVAGDQTYIRTVHG